MEHDAKTDGGDCESGDRSRSRLDRSLSSDVSVYRPMTDYATTFLFRLNNERLLFRLWNEGMISVSIH